MAEGLRVTLKRVQGLTPRNVLRQPLVFPAVLGDFEWEEEATHSDYETLSAGEFSAPGPGGRDARRLRQIELEVLAPETAGGYGWLIDDRADFARVHRELMAVLRSRRPVHLRAALRARGPAEFSEPVTIRRVSRILRHAQLGHRYFTVACTEWRDTSVTRRTSDPDDAKLPVRIELGASDTAEKLSERFYGRPTGALTILFANGLRRWGKATPIVQSKRFKVGDRFTIPKPPKTTGFARGRPS